MKVLEFFELKGKQKLGDALLAKMDEKYHLTKYYNHYFYLFTLFILMWHRIPGKFDEIKEEKKQAEEKKKTYWQRVEEDAGTGTSFSFNFS